MKNNDRGLGIDSETNG